MDPRTDYSDADPTTCRAFLELFKRYGGLFEFPIDSRNDESIAELRGALSVSDPRSHPDGGSTISITGIERAEKVNKLAEAVRDMGLTIFEQESGTREDRDGTEYQYDFFGAYAESDGSAEWDVPHLVIYGGLSPEFEESINAAFGKRYDYTDIRNHTLIWGKKLDREAQTRLTTTVQGANNYFAEDKRSKVSDIRTADLV